MRPTDEDLDFGYAVIDDYDEEGDTILTRAARRCQGEIIRALVGSGKVDANRVAPNGGLPLVLAIRSEGTACVESLLSADGMDANAAVNPTFNRAWQQRCGRGGRHDPGAGGAGG